jgi:hypothetical protein
LNAKEREGRGSVTEPCPKDRSSLPGTLNCFPRKSISVVVSEL